MHAEWESSLPRACLPGLGPPLAGPGSTCEWGSCDSEAEFPEGWPQACIKLPRPELVKGLFPRGEDGRAGGGEERMILRQGRSCTFVGGHEVLSLVFAVVEATGEDQVIIVTLEEESVRSATGQEGAPFGGGTAILLPLGSWGGSHPRVPPIHLLVLFGGVQLAKSDLELPLLGLASGCPLSCPGCGRPCSEAGYGLSLSAAGLTSWPVMSSLRKAMDSSSLPRLVRARRQESRLSNRRSRNSMDFRAFSCTTRA